MDIAYSSRCQLLPFFLHHSCPMFHVPEAGDMAPGLPRLDSEAQDSAVSSPLCQKARHDPRHKTVSAMLECLHGLRPRPFMWFVEHVVGCQP